MIRFAAVLYLLIFSSAGSAYGQTGLACKEHIYVDRLTRRPVTSECWNLLRGAEKKFRAQIANGQAAPDEQHTAAIFYTRNDGERAICTGILLDKDNVLTAGHCGCGRPDSYRVSFEQFPFKDNKVVKPILIKGAPILFDPLTCLLGRSLPGGDLALLKLAENPIGIRDLYYGYPAFILAGDSDLRQKLAPRKMLKVVGYGETETGSIAMRMMAYIPVLTSNCRERPYDAFCMPFLEMILADRSGGRSSRDTCGGDSGGPVFVRMFPPLLKCQSRHVLNTFEDDENKPQAQDVLVAITSRAAPFTHAFASQHCGGGGIYTLIGRRSVHAWFAANNVKAQTCVIDLNMMVLQN